MFSFIKAVIVVSAFMLSVPAAAKSTKIMKYSVRQMVTVDAKEMETLVDQQAKKYQNEDDEDIYLDGVSRVLAQTILIHRNVVERAAGIQRLRRYLGDGDMVEVMRRAGESLLNISMQADTTADRVTAHWALTTFVKEAKALKKEDQKFVLETVRKIAKRKFKFGKRDRKYSKDSLLPILNPNEEAMDALKKMKVQSI